MTNNASLITTLPVPTRPTGCWWRLAVAACIAVALTAGGVACGSSSDPQVAQAQDDEQDIPAVDGKYDMSGFPSGQYTSANFTWSAGKLLSLNLRPDKTFVRESVGDKTTPPGGIHPIVCMSPDCMGPKKDMGTYKFSKTSKNLYVKLYTNGSLLVKYEYTMEGGNSSLKLRDATANSTEWVLMVRAASQSECYRTDDCMPGETCQGANSAGTCPKGAYCILPDMGNTGTCQAKMCTANCDPWETCVTLQGGGCPSGAYCILPVTTDRCVPTTCAQNADCGAGAFCDTFDSCPKDAYCVLTTVAKGVCKPTPPSPCPAGAYCILPHQASNASSGQLGPSDSVDDWRTVVEQQLQRA
jgi:hypothetical protein